jgi:hypothetical protein
MHRKNEIREVEFDEPPDGPEVAVRSLAVSRYAVLPAGLPNVLPSLAGPHDSILQLLRRHCRRRVALVVPAALTLAACCVLQAVSGQQVEVLSG